DDDVDATSTAFEAVAGGMMGDEVIAYFASIGAGPKKPEKLIAHVETNVAGVLAAPIQAADVAAAAHAIVTAKGNRATAPSAIRLQTTPHAAYMFGRGRRFTADENGVVIA